MFQFTSTLRQHGGFRLRVHITSGSSNVKDRLFFVWKELKSTLHANIAVGRDRTPVPRIMRNASWPLTQRGALFFVNPPWVFAVTLLPQILSHTVTRISTHRTVYAALPSEVQVLPSVQRASGSQSYTIMFQFTSTLRQYGGFRLSVHITSGSPNVKDCLLNPYHFTCKYCRGRDRSHVPRITRKASWPLAQRSALYFVNPPRVFAVTT